MSASRSPSCWRDSPALAEDGVGAIALDIEELPPVPDRHASGRGDILLFEEAGTNAAMVFTGVKGDADAAFRDADYVRRERFAVQRYTALPMEPRGVLAEWDAAQGRMTVLGAAKVPFFNRDTLAAMLGLSPAQVDLIENDVGGGFGARGEFYPEDFLIPFAARHVGRPVRWIEDRREHLTAMNHARQADCEVEIACRSDGTILGLRGEVFVDLGAYVRTNGLIQPRTLAQCFTGPYRVPNVRMTSTALLTNKTPSGTYRAPGRYEGSFFCERLIELAARDLGIDSAEMRRRNLIGAGEMPYRLPRLEPGGPAVDTECDSGDYREALERCLAEFGWEEKRALQGREIDGRYHGVAVACFIEGGGAGPKETARLDLEADGTVSVYVGSTAVGQGLETVMAQIAADTLGLPLGQVRVLHGSTPFLDEGYGAFASRSTVLGGSAVFEAANALLDKIRAAAAARLGVRRRTGRTGGWMRPRSATGARSPSPSWRRTACGSTTAFAQRQPADLHLRIGGGACRGRPGDGRCRVARLSRRRGCRPHRQPVDVARPGDRRRGPGARRRLPGEPRL